MSIWFRHISDMLKNFVDNTIVFKVLMNIVSMIIDIFMNKFNSYVCVYNDL